MKKQGIQFPSFMVTPPAFKSFSNTKQKSHGNNEFSRNTATAVTPYTSSSSNSSGSKINMTTTTRTTGVTVISNGSTTKQQVFSNTTSNQTMTVLMSEEMIEVQDIFRRVDDAFRKRKEDNESLSSEIADLESQMGYLELQTQQQREINGNCSTINAVSCSGVNKLHRDSQDFRDKSLEPLKEVFSELVDVLDTSFGIADRYTADVKALDALTQSLRVEAADMRAGLEVKISKMLLQQEELHSVQSKAEQKAVEQQDQEAALATLQASIVTIEVEIAAAEKLLAVDRLKLQDSATVLDQRRVSLSDLLKLRSGLEDEAAALSACMEGIRGAVEGELADWERKLEVLRTELGTCEGQKVANYSLLSARKEANDAFKEGNTSRDTEVKQWQHIWSERSAVLAAVQSSSKQLELEAIPAARTALQAGIDKVKRTFEFNEEQYQLTVQRMGELKEAHEVQAALQHKHHVLKEKLVCRVNERRVEGCAAEALVLSAQKELETRMASRKHQEEWLAENRTALSSLANRTAHCGTEIGLLEQTLRFLSQQQEEAREELGVRDGLRMQVSAGGLRLVDCGLRGGALEQRVKEVDQALLAAHQQYAALNCSLVDRCKAVLSVEELLQVQVELEPELVLLQLSLERQQAVDVEELQRCIDELEQGFQTMPGKVRNDDELQGMHIDIAVMKRELQTVETELLTCTSIQDDRSTSCDPHPPSDDELVLHTRTSPDHTALCSNPQGVVVDVVDKVVQSIGNERDIIPSSQQQHHQVVASSHPQSAARRDASSSSQWELSQRAKTLPAASDTRKVRPPPAVHEDPLEEDLWDREEDVGYVDLPLLQEEEEQEEEQEGIQYAASRGPEKGLKKQRRAALREERTNANQAAPVIIPIDNRPSNPVDRPSKRIFPDPVIRQGTSQSAAHHPAEYQQQNSNSNKKNKMPHHHGSAAQQGKGTKVLDSRAMQKKESDDDPPLLVHKPNLPNRKAGRGGGGGGKHSAGRGGGGGPVRLEPLRKQPALPAAAPRVVAAKKVSPGDWFLEDDTPW